MVISKWCSLFILVVCAAVCSLADQSSEELTLRVLSQEDAETVLNAQTVLRQYLIDALSNVRDRLHPYNGYQVTVRNIVKGLQKRDLDPLKLIKDRRFFLYNDEPPPLHQIAKVIYNVQGCDHEKQALKWEPLLQVIPELSNYITPVPRLNLKESHFQIIDKIERPYSNGMLLAIQKNYLTVTRRLVEGILSNYRFGSYTPDLSVIVENVNENLRTHGIEFDHFNIGSEAAGYEKSNKILHTILTKITQTSHLEPHIGFQIAQLLSALKNSGNNKSMREDSYIENWLNVMRDDEYPPDIIQARDELYQAVKSKSVPTNFNTLYEEMKGYTPSEKLLGLLSKLTLVPNDHPTLRYVHAIYPFVKMRFLAGIDEYFRPQSQSDIAFLLNSFLTVRHHVNPPLISEVYKLLTARQFPWEEVLKDFDFSKYTNPRVMVIDMLREIMKNSRDLQACELIIFNYFIKNNIVNSCPDVVQGGEDLIPQIAQKLEGPVVPIMADLLEQSPLSSMFMTTTLPPTPVRVCKEGELIKVVDPNCIVEMIDSQFHASYIVDLIKYNPMPADKYPYDKRYGVFQAVLDDLKSNKYKDEISDFVITQAIFRLPLNYKAHLPPTYKYICPEELAAMESRAPGTEALPVRITTPVPTTEPEVFEVVTATPSPTSLCAKTIRVIDQDSLIEIISTDFHIKFIKEVILMEPVLQEDYTNLTTREQVLKAVLEDRRKKINDELTDFDLSQAILRLPISWKGELPPLVVNVCEADLKYNVTLPPTLEMLTATPKVCTSERKVRVIDPYAIIEIMGSHFHTQFIEELILKEPIPAERFAQYQTRVAVYRAVLEDRSQQLSKDIVDIDVNQAILRMPLNWKADLPPKFIEICEDVDATVSTPVVAESTLAPVRGCKENEANEAVVDVGSLIEIIDDEDQKYIADLISRTPILASKYEALGNRSNILKTLLYDKTLENDNEMATSIILHVTSRLKINERGDLRPIIVEMCLSLSEIVELSKALRETTPNTHSPPDTHTLFSESVTQETVIPIEELVTTLPPIETSTIQELTTQPQASLTEIVKFDVLAGAFTETTTVLPIETETKIPISEPEVSPIFAETTPGYEVTTAVTDLCSANETLTPIINSESLFDALNSAAPKAPFIRSRIKLSIVPVDLEKNYTKAEVLEDILNTIQEEMRDPRVINNVEILRKHIMHDGPGLESPELIGACLPFIEEDTTKPYGGDPKYKFGSNKAPASETPIPDLVLEDSCLPNETVASIVYADSLFDALGPNAPKAPYIRARINLFIIPIDMTKTYTKAEVLKDVLTNLREEIFDSRILSNIDALIENILPDGPGLDEPDTVEACLLKSLVEERETTELPNEISPEPETPSTISTVSIIPVTIPEIVSPSPVSVLPVSIEPPIEVMQPAITEPEPPKIVPVEPVPPSPVPIVIPSVTDALITELNTPSPCIVKQPEPVQIIEPEKPVMIQGPEEVTESVVTQPITPAPVTLITEEPKKPVIIEPQIPQPVVMPSEEPVKVETAIPVRPLIEPSTSLSPIEITNVPMLQIVLETLMTPQSPETPATIPPVTVTPQPPLVPEFTTNPQITEAPANVTEVLPESSSQKVENEGTTNCSNNETLTKIILNNDLLNLLPPMPQAPYLRSQIKDRILRADKYPNKNRLEVIQALIAEIVAEAKDIRVATAARLLINNIPRDRSETVKPATETVCLLTNLDNNPNIPNTSDEARLTESPKALDKLQSFDCNTESSSEEVLSNSREVVVNPLASTESQCDVMVEYIDPQSLLDMVEASVMAFCKNIVKYINGSNLRKQDYEKYQSRTDILQAVIRKTKVEIENRYKTNSIDSLTLDNWLGEAQILSENIPDTESSKIPPRFVTKCYENQSAEVEPMEKCPDGVEYLNMRDLVEVLTDYGIDSGQRVIEVLLATSIPMKNYSQFNKKSDVLRAILEKMKTEIDEDLVKDNHTLADIMAMKSLLQEVVMMTDNIDVDGAMDCEPDVIIKCPPVEVTSAKPPVSDILLETIPPETPTTTPEMITSSSVVAESSQSETIIPETSTPEILTITPFVEPETVTSETETTSGETTTEMLTTTETEITTEFTEALASTATMKATVTPGENILDGNEILPKPRKVTENVTEEHKMDSEQPSEVKLNFGGIVDNEGLLNDQSASEHKKKKGKGKIKTTKIIYNTNESIKVVLKASKNKLDGSSKEQMNDDTAASTEDRSISPEDLQSGIEYMNKSVKKETTKIKGPTSFYLGSMQMKGPTYKVGENGTVTQKLPPEGDATLSLTAGIIEPEVAEEKSVSYNESSSEIPLESASSVSTEGVNMSQLLELTQLFSGSDENLMPVLNENGFLNDISTAVAAASNLANSPQLDDSEDQSSKIHQVVQKSKTKSELILENKGGGPDSPANGENNPKGKFEGS